MKPDDDTDDYLPALPPEDRWFEDDADPSPSLMSGLPAYPAEWAEVEPPPSPPRSGAAILLAAVAVAMLVYFADQALRGR